MTNFFTDILLNSSLLNKLVFSDKDAWGLSIVILSLFILVCIISTINSIREKKYFSLFLSVSFFSLLFCLQFSLIGINSSLLEKYGFQNKIYYTLNQEVFDSIPQSERDSIFLSQKGFVVEKLPYSLEFKRIGKINCEHSLADCNNFLVKNSEKTKEFLKEKQP